MTTPTSLHLDYEHTRALARELESASQTPAPSVPPLPRGPAVGSFTASLEAALVSMRRQHQALTKDLGHLSRTGFALATAAQTTDSAAASRFNSQEARL